ncbi:hypothetical protein DVA86_22995 [Streptomyces armeniacus]|uniref:Uncharacterized protein n=1 Tax=Streptomyces armeniacus TaxID=83291 RepID=A0A345XTW9_9ACTN|nr:hypothetical protein [Streptomyces armeniacus]AXK35085.1 hypothetical protein DVA86_22995 [Streptomyces armeniacus]
MQDRSLEALGYAGVPAREPLIYPGRLVGRPSFLNGDELLDLRPSGAPLGDWPVALPAGASERPQRATVDGLLTLLGVPPAQERFPVLAVGSNAAPGQVRHKLARLGSSGALPMVPVRVRGISVGLSGHISPAGYVAAAPYADPDAESPLVATWLDAAQLNAVDSTELPNYGRAFLPGDAFPVTLPSGRRLPGAYLYYNARGILAHPDGTPRAGGAQPAVLAQLLSESPRLRELFGHGPESWTGRAGADAELRARGTAAFEAEGWLRREDGFARYAVRADRP